MIGEEIAFAASCIRSHNSTMSESSLAAEAARLYDAYRLDDLPRALRRNSLDYYYLSVYPALPELQPLNPDDWPPYPPIIRNAYVHVPFCSGVCDFCSYYLVAVGPRRRAAVGRYLEQVQAEFDIHARRAALDITYLYIGGGTPSLIPPDALERFLAHLTERRYLNPAAVGTLELHPEFFADEANAARFLAILKRHGIGRVSVGYQASDEAILRDSNRRHKTGFLGEAMAFLRANGFLVNLDLMYGLPALTLAEWEATLSDAIAAGPDSISTYFLFVDRGTGLYERVQRGRVALPDHRHIQTQHLMAQLALQAAGYHELPNDFWARDVGDPATFRPARLPSTAATLPVGPGAYGYYSDTQLCNVFDLAEYGRRVAGGLSPLWRGHRLDAATALRRDVMFALKNDPYIDCSLFRSAYNTCPIDAFAPTFARLAALDLLTIEPDCLRLTAKGRLCVEEIAWLFRQPSIGPAADAAGSALLAKHNFAPSYPPPAW